MEDFIRWYSDIKLTPMVTPTGFNWNQGDNNLVAGVLFDRDMSPLFPWINAMVEKAVYLAQPPFIRFRYEKILCALHPFYLAAFPFTGREQATAFITSLIAFFNDLYHRRNAIRPNYKTYNPVSVMEIIKLLPRTNCRKCGYPTCMAFAGAVRMGKTVPRQCPELSAPVMEQVVYPIYDENGNVVETVSLQVDSSHAYKELDRQKEIITDLEKRVAALQQLQSENPADYTPPFGVELSPRELEVLRLVAHGATNTEISQILTISPHTVKSHVISIFNKLGVNDRTQAGVWAARSGIL